MKFVLYKYGNVTEKLSHILRNRTTITH